MSTPTSNRSGLKTTEFYGAASAVGAIVLIANADLPDSVRITAMICIAGVALGYAALRTLAKRNPNPGDDS